MIPHAFAASQLASCAPPFALPRRFAPLPAHVGACLKLALPLLCEHKSEERAYTLESYSI